MTVISILVENGEPNGTHFRAVAGSLQSVGKTPGQALDGLTSQLAADESGTLVVVQQWRPDHFFTAAQQQRLAELMQRWRDARDGQTPLSPEEQAELEALTEAELRAAGERAAALDRQLNP